MSWLDQLFGGVVSILVNGVPLPQEQALNLLASTNVTLTGTDAPGSGTTTVAIASTGSGGGGYSTLQVNGVALTAETSANFVAGAGVTIAGSTVGSVSTITIAGTTTTPTNALVISGESYTCRTTDAVVRIDTVGGTTATVTLPVPTNIGEIHRFKWVGWNDVQAQPVIVANAGDYLEPFTGMTAGGTFAASTTINTPGATFSLQWDGDEWISI